MHVTPPLEASGTKFGESVSFYTAGRKAYPEEIFDIISSHLPKTASILELGCGTGLATKQLYEHGFRNIIATDIDPLMLQAAQKLCPQIAFQTADTNALPFKNHLFDAIVSFASFHWFCTPQAIEEIKRVLATEGIFFAINKNDTGLFRDEFRKFLEALEDRPILEGKAHYQPIGSLIKHNFAVETRAIATSESFTKKELLAYLQSISLWTSLPKEKQLMYLPHLESFLTEVMGTSEVYQRQIETQILSARLLKV